MLTLFTIFIAIVGVGLAFWFYNRRQIKNLSEQIQDKTAVINAFRSHVEPNIQTEITVESKITKINPNDEWRGNSTQVIEKTSKKKNPNPKTGGKKFPAQKKQKQDVKSEFNSDKKNRPNPKKKNKPTE